MSTPRPASPGSVGRTAECTRKALLRQRIGATQAHLAHAMGVSQARVSAMERGELDTLTVASVRTYVDALGGTVRLVASLDDTDVTLRLPAA